MVAAAAYAPPLRASITPVGSKATMAAKAVRSLAGPLERPTTPAMFAAAGVTSNWASKVPVWEATALFCQAPALVRDGVGVLGAGGGLEAVGLVILVYRHRWFRTLMAASSVRNRACRLG